jgi:hypothetical protein
MIDATMKLIGRSLSSAEESNLDAWVPWSYVRNAVVHSGGLVTVDLSAKWPERFPKRDLPLQLRSEDLMACQAAAQKIVSAVDSQFVPTVVGIEDCRRLVRELFVRHGIDDRSRLAKIVSEQLRTKFGINEAQKAIDYQRKFGRMPDEEGIVFSEDFLASIVL